MTLSGKKIGFIGKGGAGKSTCAVLLARTMRDRGYDVCILDTDSTNLGLHLALGIEKPPRPLIDHFGGMVFHGGSVTCPVDDPTLLPNADVDLERLPAQFAAKNDAGVVLLVAGKLADFGVGAGCDGPLVKIARDLVVRRNGQPMTMLVDLKAGLEDTSRGAIVGMDQVVVVCDPSVAGLGIARSMKQMVDDLHHGAEPATSHIESPHLVELARRLFQDPRLKSVEVLLNEIRDEETAKYMTQMMAESGIEPLALLPKTAGIQEAWLRGGPLPTNGLASVLDAALDRMESQAVLTGAVVQ